MKKIEDYTTDQLELLRDQYKSKMIKGILGTGVSMAAAKKGGKMSDIIVLAVPRPAPNLPATSIPMPAVP